MILGFYRLKKSHFSPEIWSFKDCKKIYSFQIFCEYSRNFHKIWISFPLITFFSFFSSWNDYQFLEQCRYSQMHIQIANKYNNSSNQIHQKIEIWWKLTFQNIWIKFIFLTIFKRSYFWTRIWFFQPVKT